MEQSGSDRVAADRAVTTDESRYPWAAVAGVFLAVTLALTVVTTWADSTMGRLGHTGLHWLDGWFRFDSGWYWAIVSDGYSYSPGQQSSIAFFPVFPLINRALVALVGDTHDGALVQVVGQVLSVTFGLAAVVLFGHWVWQRLPRRSAVLAIAVILAYPYTLFLHGPVYADGMFLLLAIGAFMLLDRRWYVAAGLVGALAVASRPFGVAVAVGLVVRTLEMLAANSGGTGWRDVVVAVRRVRPRHTGVLLAFGGLLAWMAYLWTSFGNPLAFVEVESAPGWDQGVGPHTWFKVALIDAMAQGHWRMGVNLGLQALACLLVVLLLPRVVRRFGWGYAAYTAVVIAIPILGTKDFMGAGRYALAAFPALAAGGDWLAERPRWVTTVVVGLMAVVMVVLTLYFARNREVS
ncbi:mannosyltransferase family protein [Cellulomonas citrea]|uniref:mannosyltransferase family protein n=1 Tax=Cellulomonas citrea TaxID=1909423 RepID=UPI00135CD86E|nr:mannosyltransferase family protein [Cellulomonas citrea]